MLDHNSDYIIIVDDELRFQGMLLASDVTLYTKVRGLKYSH